MLRQNDVRFAKLFPLIYLLEVLLSYSQLSMQQFSEHLLCARLSVRDILHSCLMTHYLVRLVGLFLGHALPP